MCPSGIQSKSLSNFLYAYPCCSPVVSWKKYSIMWLRLCDFSPAGSVDCWIKYDCCEPQCCKLEHLCGWKQRLQCLQMARHEGSHCIVQGVRGVGGFQAAYCLENWMFVQSQMLKHMNINRNMVLGLCGSRSERTLWRWSKQCSGFTETGICLWGQLIGNWYNPPANHPSWRYLQVTDRSFKMQRKWFHYNKIIFDQASCI